MAKKTIKTTKSTAKKTTKKATKKEESNIGKIYKATGTGLASLNKTLQTLMKDKNVKIQFVGVDMAKKDTKSETTFVSTFPVTKWLYQCNCSDDTRIGYLYNSMEEAMEGVPAGHVFKITKVTINETK